MYSWIKQSKIRLLICVSLGVMLLAAGLVVAGRQGAAQAAPATTISLVAPDQARTGEPIRVKLIVEGARNLAGFQTTVRYDSAAQLRVLDAAPVEGLRGSGRDLLPLGPVFRSDSVVFGGVTCPVSDCESGQYSSAARQPQGVNGHVELGELVFDALAPGSYVLRLDDVMLVDPSGNVLPASTVDLVLVVK